MNPQKYHGHKRAFLCCFAQFSKSENEMCNPYQPVCDEEYLLETTVTNSAILFEATTGNYLYSVTLSPTEPSEPLMKLQVSFFALWMVSLLKP